MDFASAAGDNKVIIDSTQPNPFSPSLANYVEIAKIPYYYRYHKMDSLKQGLQKLNFMTIGSTNELYHRINLLIAIDTGGFNSNQLDSNIINHLSIYRWKQKEIEKDGYKWFSLLDSSLDNFTIELAKEILRKNTEEDTGFLLAKFYSNNFSGFFSALKKTPGQLRTYYNNHTEKLIKEMETDGTTLSCSIGFWNPLASLSLLGIHPAIGVSFGKRLTKMRYDAIISYRFIKSKNEYITKKEGNLVATDEYEGIYLGVDVGYNIAQSRYKDIDVFGAFAWDRIGTTEYIDEKPKILSGLSLGGGIRYRFYYNKYRNRFIGCQIRVMYNNYHNVTGGTKLEGLTIAFSLFFGGISETSIPDELKLLDY
jgi:hypothetical protein